jgi:hypothetical protein
MEREMVAQGEEGMTTEIGKNLMRLGMVAAGVAVVIVNQYTGGDGESMLLAGGLIGAAADNYLSAKIAQAKA